MSFLNRPSKVAEVVAEVLVDEATQGTDQEAEIALVKEMTSRMTCFPRYARGQTLKESLTNLIPECPSLT